MKKIILFLIILAGLALLEPRSRARIMNVVRPVSEAGHERAAKRTLRQIAIDVQRTKARTGFYPQPGDFRQWLQQTYRNAEDPWGSEYYLEIFPDSFVVASQGADFRKRTADDIRLVKRREATAGGLGSALSPPAPPSSKVKASAIRKAKEHAARNSGSAQGR